MEIPLLRELVIIFCLSILVIYACNKLKIPPILGFLITGVVCGPYGLGLVEKVEQVEMVSEVGIVLLLFSVGLEHMSVSELIRLKKPVFLGGTTQVLLSIACFALLAVLFGQHWNSAIFGGFIISLSSTAIVLSIMQAKGEVASPQGRVIMAILLYQDLIVVPMMLAVPLLTGQAHILGAHSAFAALRTIVILGASFVLARKIVPLIMRKVAATRIRELFLLSTIGICFAVAYLTSLMGLSLSLGAFLAGMILGESEYSFSALEGIMPFKDVFTSLFFIAVGMLLNLGFFAGHFKTIILLTAAVLLLKTLCATATGLVLGYPLRIALIIGIGLCQIGEFSFVLAKTGLDSSLLTPDQYQMFLAAIILTMACTPSLLALAPRLAALAGREPARSEAGQSGTQEAELSGHMIIAGFGIAGRHLAQAAAQFKIPYTILEMNPETVYKLRKTEPIRYGDASKAAELEKAGLARASMLAVVISDRSAAQAVTEVARHLNPNLCIVVRTPYQADSAHLTRLGANLVLAEDLETSLAMLGKVLPLFSVPPEGMEKFIYRLKTENETTPEGGTGPGTARKTET